jgi:hypothetical protein
VLSKQAIEEYQKIYSETSGKELSFAEAVEEAHQMFRFFKFALGYPLTKQEKDSIDEQSQN